MSRAHARTVTKLAVLREAAAAGSTLLTVTDYEIGRSNAVGGAIAALFGGSLSVDYLQVLHLSSRGTPCMFVQPYSGVYTLPGEHHVWLQGTLRAPANWEVGAFSDRWQSPDAPTVQQLQMNAGLSATLRGTKWEWRMGSGEIRYPWVLQTRPFRGGLTHLAMKATGAMIGLSGLKQSGFVALLQTAMQLQPSLMAAPGYLEFPFVVPSMYAGLYTMMLEGALAPTAIAGKTPPTDFSQAIVAALSAVPANKLLVYPLAPVKENAVRGYVLPQSAKHLPLLAMIDSTMMGSAKEGLAFTPTHGFYKHGDAEISFAWTDVRAVIPPSPSDDEVVAMIAPYGEIALPCAGRAQQLAQLLHWFSQHP